MSTNSLNDESDHEFEPNITMTILDLHPKFFIRERNIPTHNNFQLRCENIFLFMKVTIRETRIKQYYLFNKKRNMFFNGKTIL